MAQVIKDHTEMRRSFARAERWIYVQKKGKREWRRVGYCVDGLKLK